MKFRRFCGTASGVVFFGASVTNDGPAVRALPGTSANPPGQARAAGEVPITPLLPPLGRPGNGSHPVADLTALVTPEHRATRRPPWGERAGNLLLSVLFCLAAGQGQAAAAEGADGWQKSPGMKQPSMSLSWQAPSADSLHELMVEAEEHYQQKRDAEALSIFSSLIELSPVHRADALLRVGNIRQRNGSPGAALDTYRQLLALRPEDVVGQQELPERASGRARTVRKRDDIVSDLVLGVQAARLKAMINLSVMSLEQGREVLGLLQAMPRDSRVWQAAGMNQQMTHALADNLLAQTVQIQQMLAGGDGSADAQTGSALQASGVAPFGLHAAGRVAAGLWQGSHGAGALSATAGGARVADQVRHRVDQHRAGGHMPDFIIGRPAPAASPGQAPGTGEAQPPEPLGQGRPAMGAAAQAAGVDGSPAARGQRPVVEYRIKPDSVRSGGGLVP